RDGLRPDEGQLRRRPLGTARGVPRHRSGPHDSRHVDQGVRGRGEGLRRGSAPRLHRPVRRATAGVALTLVGAGLAQALPASAAPVDVSGMFGGFRATAVWTFAPDTPRSAQTFAFADVYQPVTSLDGSGIAVVGVGACVFVHDDDRSRQCTGSGFTHEIVAGELQLSPTLGNAKLDYFERGNGYHVTWSATDVVPTVTPSYGTSEHAVAAG